MGFLALAGVLNHWTSREFQWNSGHFFIFFYRRGKGSSVHTSGLWEMKTEVCTLISAKRVDLVKVNSDVDVNMTCGLRQQSMGGGSSDWLANSLTRWFVFSLALNGFKSINFRIPMQLVAMPLKLYSCTSFFVVFFHVSMGKFEIPVAVPRCPGSGA